jgi:hypothetical protein
LNGSIIKFSRPQVGVEKAYESEPSSNAWGSWIPISPIVLTPESDCHNGNQTGEVYLCDSDGDVQGHAAPVNGH